MIKPIKHEINSKYIKLEDYKIFDFQIPETYLNFIIEKDKVIVKTELKVKKINKEVKEIKLDGIDITIQKIFVNDILLEENSFIKQETSLKIYLNQKDIFKINIEGFIKPKENTALLGMYESNGIITTQCEAEGFRRISYSSDRPDILSKYTVRIEADKTDYPILLSNGNLLNKKILNKNRHEVIWEDPFPKPSYLFALVAGKLNCTKDYFFTKSNKKVDINIYVEEGYEKFVGHAMVSLKKAMEWDEKKYNLEYDLSIFNVVAIRHFNMGAMENKGLNIFNSKLILADSETATDEELERIESVIAHEYFHNWTGNRITCRDWFQLSLKEGLTVFRDQQFTADAHNYSIKRIEDVKFLRSNQFREDSGPTSHPVQPEKYLEIDNFYTTTIYEKGSEIIRMLKTVVKDNNFYSGFNDFISKYDGQAATIDNFLETILNNNKVINLEKFKIWYRQNGTPKINFERIWNKDKQNLIIKITQKNINKRNSFNKIPLIIPIKIAVFLSNTKKVTKTFILNEKKENFIIENINTEFDKPIVSYFREFSAPVEWKSDTTFNEKLLILKNETDLFTRYDTIKGIYKTIISQRLINKPNIEIENKLIETIKSIINDEDFINLSLLSELINIPVFSEIESEIKEIDPLKIYKTVDDLNYLFGKKLNIELNKKLKEIEPKINKKWPEGKDERKLIEIIWKLLVHSNDKNIKRKIVSFVDGNSMTLAKSALNVLADINCPERKEISDLFFERWKNNSVVLDSWFYFKASIKAEDNLESIEELFKNEYFDYKSPNTIRSILNAYATRNRSFHSIDGKGYKYISEKIVKLDKLNPILMARFLKIFSRYKLYTKPYRENMIKCLRYIKQSNLSSNTREVIEAILN